MARFRLRRARHNRRRRARRNSPTTGALFLRANRGHKRRRSKSRRNRGGLSALVRRLRKNSRRRRSTRRNGLAMRMNRRSLAERKTARAAWAKKQKAAAAKSRRARKSLSASERAEYRRGRKQRSAARKSRKLSKHGSWEAYTAAKEARRARKKSKLGLRKNRGHKRRRSRRNGLALRANFRRIFRRRRNTGAAAAGGTGGMTFPGLSLVTGLVKKVPVLGARVAPYIGPAVFGAAGLYASKMALKYGGKYLPAQVKPFGYTIAGIVLGTVAALLPFGGKYKKPLVAAAVIGGGAVDAFRYASGTSQALGADDFTGLALGDGGAYEIAGFGDAVSSQYADAEMADALLCGPDLDAYEGEAALAGAMGWFGTFGRPAKRAAGAHRHHSRHAGKPGHRWAWVIKLVGFENFQKIAAKEPSERLEIIKALKAQAVAALPGLLSPVAMTPALTASEPLNLSGLGYGEQLGSAYGALVYAGRSM